MPKQPKSRETITAVTLETRQKIKVLASLEAQSMVDWLEWMVNKAYEAKVHKHARNESK